MVGRVMCLDSEFAARETNPQWGVSIGTGQGRASGDKAPARYPRMRTNRGRGVSTESRGLRRPKFMDAKLPQSADAVPGAIRPLIAGRPVIDAADTTWTHPRSAWQVSLALLDRRVDIFYGHVEVRGPLGMPFVVARICSARMSA